MWCDRSTLAIMVLVLTILSGCAQRPEQGSDETSVTPTLTCMDPCGVVIHTGVRWEPSVAVDPNDPLHLVASSQDQSSAPGKFLVNHWADAHVSSDGGLTWESHRIPGGEDEDPSHPLYAYNAMDDSVVVILQDGTVLWTALVWTRGAVEGEPGSTPPSVVALRSHDGGRTFPDITFVKQAAGWQTHGIEVRDSHDKQWPVVLPDGRVLLVWSNNKDNHPDCGVGPLSACTDIVFSVSSDSGATWTAPRLITATIASGAFPVILHDGSWLVSYHVDSDADFHVARSDDEGTTWESGKRGDSTKFPAMTVTNRSGRVYVVFPGGDVGRDDQQDISLIWSDDNGTTWSPPLRIDTPEQAGRTIPAIAPAGRDDAIVTYLFPDPTGAEVRAAYIADGAVVSRITIGNMSGLSRHSGDYMGLTALPEGDVYVVWNEVYDESTTLKGARLRLTGDRHP